MSIIPILLPVLASTAGVGQTPECTALSGVSNLLRIGDEGLRYCSSILSIGTVVDPVYSTVTAILTTTISEITLTDTTLLTEILNDGTSYITAPEVTETRTIIVPTTTFRCTTEDGGSAPPLEVRRGLDALWNHPKVTMVDYPHTTPIAYGEPSEAYSDWLHLPSSTKHHKTSKYHHTSSSSVEHASSSVPSSSSSFVISSSSSIAISNSASPSGIVISSSSIASSSSPSPTPSSSTPTPTPSSSLASSSSPAITPTPTSTPSPTPTPGPSCSTAPAAVVYLACDIISTACSCLSLTSATPTSTVTTTSLLSRILDTLNTITITIQDVTTITVPAVFDTTTPTVTATTMSAQVTTICPCAAPTPDLCGNSADACVDLQRDQSNCGACGVACAEGECVAGSCLFVPRRRVRGAGPLLR